MTTQCQFVRRTPGRAPAHSAAVASATTRRR